MAYAADEVSQRGGKPNELYRFRGTYANYYYTSGPRDVTWQAPDDDEPQLYKSIALERSAVNAGTQEDDKLDLTITMAVTHQLVLDYGFQATPPRLNLTIWRYHTLDSVVPFWYGPVDNIQTTKGRASIRSFSQLGAVLAQDFPNVYYQSPCNNVLYDARCKVLEADWTANVGILALAGRTITVEDVTADNENLTGNALIGGEVRLASGERRMITAQQQIVIPGEDEEPDVDATVLTVNFPFSVLEVGDVVATTAGCNLAYRGDCKVKFANQRNYTGFPHSPPENPFTDGIEPAAALPDNTCLSGCEPCPRLTTFTWELAFNGCKEFYCPTRNWYMPEITGHPTPFFKHRPNLPVLAEGETWEDYESNGWPGKTWGNTISIWNSCGASGISLYESNAYNEPGSGWYQDPRAIRLQGQPMIEYSTSNGDCTMILHGALVDGGGALQVQYGAFWCGDFVAQGKLTRTLSSGCEPKCTTTPSVLIESGLVGNVPYTWNW